MNKFFLIMIFCGSSFYTLIGMEKKQIKRHPSIERIKSLDKLSEEYDERKRCEIVVMTSKKMQDKSKIK